MSNNQVGNVYAQIIDDVITSSRLDFEEGGVDERVLHELRMRTSLGIRLLIMFMQGWQQKLSQLQVAQFPWDPKPEPPPQPAVSNPNPNPPTVPSNSAYQSQNSPAPQPQNPLPMPQQHNNGGPRIKTEPGLESQGMTMPQPPFQQPLSHPPNTPVAQQRAAQHLHASYGPRAAASISAIQGGPPTSQQITQQQMRQQQQNGGHPQNTPQMQQSQQAYNMQQRSQAMMQAQGMQQGSSTVPRPNLTPEQYKQMMGQNQAHQMQQQRNAQNQSGNVQNANVGSAQTDGAGDEEVETTSVIKRFSPSGEEISVARVEIDSLIRSKIEAMGTSMEGGGLMLPLRQAQTLSKLQHKVSKTSQGMAQTDGGDDDDKDGLKDDVDEDAINSDLDDPDDGLNEEEEDDESMGHIMLCMYDKVQRVKNKWKCVMKDGVLTVNGKEYVFHKASGEYEW
ncbi:transcription factor IIA [Diplocarpon rosae]|nr:transcription factor IIA [Diplocarpon rosae]